MLPDKSKISEPSVDVVLNMDGFGSQSLKLASYTTVMKQGALSLPASSCSTSKTRISIRQSR
jgi:hypothetical protein